MRKMEIPCFLARPPRRMTAMRQRALPALDGPIRAVGRLAGRDQPRELRPVVGKAEASERAAELSAGVGPPACVIEPEAHLRNHRNGLPSVHRPPSEDVPSAAGLAGTQKR